MSEEVIDLASSLIGRNAHYPSKFNCRGPGKPRCGVCLFRLDEDAAPSNLDADDISSKGDNTILFLHFGRRAFEISAHRGCHICEAILKYILDYGRPRTWNEKMRFRQGPAMSLAIYEEDTQDYEAQATLGGRRFHFQFVAWPEVPEEGRSLGMQRRMCVQGNTNGELALNEAATWLERCVRNHRRCDVKDNHFRPTRLLHLNSSTSPATVRLLEAANLNGQIEYAALSHRWSPKTETTRLLLSNYQSRLMTAVSAEQLPRLFQDVIAVLCRLGISFVWIDCMCIIQDDVDDWNREASSMASIYRNSKITISASRSSGCEDTLFGILKAEACRLATIGDAPVFLQREFPHPIAGIWRETGHFEWPLHRRGWVLQEELLPPRTLYFLQDEVMWQCNEVAACECGAYVFDEPKHQATSTQPVADLWNMARYESSRRRGKRDVRTNRLHLLKRPPYIETELTEEHFNWSRFENWMNLVSIYSHRRLTKEKDKLAALAGIAREFGTASGWTYWCGLWKEDLARSLSWCPGATYVPHVSLKERPRTTLPSWSWASIASPVQVSYLDSPAENIIFKGCDITYRRVTDPYLGDIERAILTVEGDTFPAFLIGLDITQPSESIGKLKSVNSFMYNTVGGPWAQVLIFGDCVVNFNPDYLIPHERMARKIPVLCLVTRPCEDIKTPLQSESYANGWDKSICWHCIVLQPVYETASLYERLGTIRLGNYRTPDHWRKAWNVSRRTLQIA